MNNPASKEPSMDEILSSIRQIIADEDQPAEQDITAPAAEQGAATPAAAVAMPEPAQSEAEADQAMMEAQEATPAIPDALEPADADGGEPLALTPDQMIAQNADDTEVDASTVDASTVDDELGISFSPASSGIDANSPPALEPETEIAEVETPAEPDEEIELVIADDIAFDEPESAPEEPAAAEAMPDPELSTQMADKLLEPTTDAAVRHTFSKLSALSMGGADLTLEGIVRDMLRPMLKEWLDENLPATVERMVEKEIERVSRGS